MAYRFNYTKRKKIVLSDVEVRVASAVSPLKVFLVANLEDYGEFSPEDKAVLEAIRRTKSQRFELGPVSSLAGKRECSFPDFADGEDVYYRLKIVDATTRRIKGLAEEIHRADRPDKPLPLKSIFPVQWADPSDGIGDQFWSVSFSGSFPVLLLSKSKFQNKDIVRFNEFKALVWPQALRNVLVHAFIVHSDIHPSWAEDWKTFVEGSLGAGALPDASDKDANPDLFFEETERWIETAVANFSRHAGLKTVEIAGLTKGQNS